MRRWLGAGLALVVFVSVLAAVPVGLPLGLGPSEASAQQVASQAVLNRVTIVEGQTRDFLISNVTSRPRYYVHVSVAGSFTAEAGDVRVTTDNLRGQAQVITPDSDAPRAHRNTTYGTVGFEVTANADSDGTGDETFGVRLCTTADCTAGTVLGEWTVTVAEPAADVTMAGTGGASWVAAGGSLSMMEKTRNRDRRDHFDAFEVLLANPPTGPIVVVAGVAATAVDSEGKSASIANVSGSFARHELSGLTASREVLKITQNDLDLLDADSSGDVSQTEWDAGATVTVLNPDGTINHTKDVDARSFEVEVVAFDNAVDSPGGSVSGALAFTVYELNDAYSDTTTQGVSPDLTVVPDTSTAPTVYSGITLADLPLTVTGDDEVTKVRVMPASPADATATEGDSSDTAKFRVSLKRALVAGESITVPLRFTGATLNSDFSVALDSGAANTGVAYADTPDTAQRNSQGAVTFSGEGAQEAALEVAALSDSDTVSRTLAVVVPETSDRSKPFYFVAHDAGGAETLAGGACAGAACRPYNAGLDKRGYRMTLAEATAGLRVIAGGDGRVAENGGTHSWQVRLNTAPSASVTVMVTSGDAAKAAVASGGTLTFTTTTWDMPQTVTVTGVDDNIDAADATVTITHSIAGTGTYAGISDVAHAVTVVDDDATTVTMTGAGVNADGSDANVSDVMVEGDASRVDRSLTVSLGRPLVAGEFVRVPLYIEAVPDAENREPVDLDTDGDGETDGLSPPHDVRQEVHSFRGPRVTANVSWPTHHNDFTMTATGAGASIAAVNRLTPNNAGYRYLEFSGAGAQTATIEMHAKDGFDDGENYDEAFWIEFSNDFATPTGTQREKAESRWQPPVTNLSGGIMPWTAGAKAWFGIDDDEEASRTDVIEVPFDWPLLPTGAAVGDKFRLLYVTKGTTGASQIGFAQYNDFVRADITGTVNALIGHEHRFAAVISTDSDSENLGGNASLNANLEGAGAEGPIYWVKGAKVADNIADFLDGDWDNETNPTHADGTAATASANGYWTGSEADGQRSDSCSGLSGSDRHLRAGAPNVSYGKLNDNSRGPLGQPVDTTNCQPAPNSEQRPLYALSTEAFTVTGGAAITGASASEGANITFTVTIPTAAPSGGITVPYTLADGRGVAGDPAHIIATGASGGTGADYDNDPGSVVIAQGQTSNTFTVATTDDSTYESDHYFTVTLGTPTGTDAPGIDPKSGTAVGVIKDDADKPTIQFSPATASASETGGTATLTVTRTGTTLVPSAVTWTTADGSGASAATHPGDYTADAGWLQFAAGDTSKTITVDITADSVSESAETFTVGLGGPVDAALGSASTATVTVTDDDAGALPTVDVALSASDGNSDGNAVEGGSGAEGYKTITITLSQALASGQWMILPLTVQGATVADDYTFRLHPASQMGVTLLGDATQNPRVQMVGNNLQTVTLRLTPVQNAVRSQPAVSISTGTPVVNGITAGEVSGGPIVFSIVDDESGVIRVDSGAFGLAPSGLSVGDRFRLIFVTSETRTAESADIDDYNRWVQGVVARGGHAGLLPYGGLVRVIGSTAAVDARENTGMWDPDANSGSGGWADGSTSAGDSGVAVYWLAAPSSEQVANNYWDFYDAGGWSGGTEGGANHSTVDRTESGALKTSGGSIWTGSLFTGLKAAAQELGTSSVRVGHANPGGTNPLDDGGVLSNTGTYPMFGISPVFELMTLPELSFNAATYSVAENVSAGTVSIQVNASPAPTSDLTVNLRSWAVTATSGGDFTAPQSFFTFPSGQTSHTFTVPIIDDNTAEGAETFTMTLTAGSGYSLGSPATTTVTITDDDATPVTVTMSASDGDANGNAVENGAGTTGYRTITITLGRALTGAETVTVPLVVQGATVADDYTFGLHPATQTGVTLLNSGTTHTAQNPALRFVSGGTSATLRLRPVNDSDREQPYAVVAYGTDARAPSGANVTLGDVTGGPIGIVLVDDETGDIEVPSSWGLVPSSGVGPGDDFRLLFRTSTGRDAASGDIADYDAFIRGVLATGGHADILPYAGFFKVLGSTRNATGSTGTTARVHNDMADEHTGATPSGGWADGSAASSVGDSAVGVPIYWLNGARLANNYADLCDLAWSSGSGVTTGWDTDDPRSEDGTRNIPTGSISDYQPYEPWTGTGNTCEAYNYPLGNSQVSKGSADRGGGQTLFHTIALGANTEQRPLYGMSPVFTVKGTAAEMGVSASGTVTEGSTLTVTVTLSKNADANLSIPVRMRTSGAPTASAVDFTLSNGGSVAITSGTRSGTLTFTAVDDDIDEDAETLVLEFGALPAGLFAGNADSVSITINDNDTAGVTVVQSGGNTAVAEDGGTDTYTVALDSQPLTNVVITATAPAGVQVSNNGGTTWGSTATITFTTANWATAKTVTVRGVNDDIDNENDHRALTITQAVTTGDTNGKYTTSTNVANVSVRVNDDDTAAVTVVGGPLTVSEDQSDTGTYTVALATQPVANITVTATAPAGARVSDDGGSSWASSVDLVFTSGTSGNWATAQTVTVRGHQDIIDNPGDQRSGLISHAIASGNGDGIRYTPTAPAKPGVSVTVTDDDAAPTAITLSVDDDLVREGDGATAIEVTATVQGATRFGVSKAVAVTVTPVADRTGFNYVDMAAVGAFTINIGAGEQSATGMFTLTPDDDNVDEVANPVAVTGSISGDTATTINPDEIVLQDDDATPTEVTLSVNPSSVTENGSARNIAVTATVDGGTVFGTAKTVAVSVAGHNTAGSVGFTAPTSLNITIPAEAPTSAVTFTLTPTDNNWDERNGAAALTGTLSGVTVDDASVTITDDDAAPSGVALGVSTATIAEDAGATIITVTATVQGATRYGSPRTVTVSQAGSGNADAVDYTATPPAAITIPAGQTSRTTTFTITPTDDAIDEFDETVTVSGSGAGIAGFSTAAITLTDDDDTTLTISAPAGAITESGGTKDVTLTLSRALVDGETVTVPLEVVGAAAGTDYTVALHPSSQAGVALSQSGSDSAQQPRVTLSTGASTAVLRFTAVADSTRTQPYVLVRYGTGARAPSGSGIDFTAPSDGPVGWVITDDETGDIVVPQSWALSPSGVNNQGEPRFRLVLVSSAQRDASSGDIAEYDAFIRGLLAEGHAAVVPYAGFFTVVGSTSGVHLRDHASVTGSASMPFYWLGETGDATKRVAATNDQFRDEWISTETPSSQSVPRNESGTVVSVDSNGYFTGSTAAGARSANPLGSTSVTVGYLDDSGSGRAPLGSGQTAANTATRSFYGLSPVFVRSSDPVISVTTSQTSVVEGTALSFTVSADPAPPNAITVRLWVSENSGRDMVVDGEQTVPFAAGDASKTLTVTTSGDNSDEADAEVTASVLNNPGYTVSATADAATVTVTDNDAMTVTVSGGGGTVNEGSSLDYTVDPGRSLLSGETVTVNFAPAGNAAQGTDYTITCHGAGVSCTGLGGAAPVLTITGGSGVRRGTIRVNALADSAHPETGETAGISLRAGHSSTGSGGAFSVSGTPSTFTISSDNSGPVVVSLARTDSGNISEGGSGAAENAEFTVTLSRQLAQGEIVVVPLVLSGAGAFYNEFTVAKLSGTDNHGVRVFRGDTLAPRIRFDGHGTNTVQTAALTLTANADLAAEAAETVTVALGPDDTSENGFDNTDLATNVGDADPHGANNAFDVNITSSTGASIDSNAIREGETKTFTVSGLPTDWEDTRLRFLSAGSSVQQATFCFPADLREQFFANWDFCNHNDRELSWDSSGGVAAFGLHARADGVSDPDEIAIFAVAESTSQQFFFPITIREPSASLSFVQFDARGSEHAEDTATLTVPLSIAPVSSSPITVGYTLAGTAVRGSDYSISGVTSNTGTLTVPANAGSASLTISFTDDSLLEGNETIEISLNSGAGYAAGLLADHRVTVSDSEKGFLFTKTELALVETGDGSAGSYRVALSQAPTGLVRVRVAKSAGSDLTVVADSTDTRAPDNELWFGTDDWQHPQIVRVTAGGDVDGANDVDSITNSASGGGYDGVTGAVSVTVLDNDSEFIGVTMSASDGDSDGNAVEGASDTTGYRTITFTLSRALVDTETMIVPLSVKGATADVDYTLALSSSHQGRTELSTIGPNRSAQDPILYITAPDSAATLRLTPIDDSDRTQPYVVIDYGTGIRLPRGSGGAHLGVLSGAPVAVVLVDDETGDVSVPANWGLVPSGLSVGDDFRLLFRTSTSRDAASGDIADYDAFIRDVLATGGHSDILPYAGFFKVFASTRSSTGSTGTTARVHNDMTSAHTGHNPTWADGSGTDSDAAGTPTYWLNGAILANNYRDLCDQAWSGSGTGVRDGFDRDDPRSEDGTRNVPTGTISNFRPYEPWTGSGNACEAWNHPLGAGTVSRGGADSGASLWHANAQANTQTRPLYGMSPVFKVTAQAATVTLGLPLDEDAPEGALPKYDVPEGDSVDVDVALSNALSTDVTISIAFKRSNGAQAGIDYTAGPWSVTIPAGATSATFSVSTIEDNLLEHDESIDIAVDADSLPSGVTAADQATVRVRILDDEYILSPGEGSYIVDERIGDVPTVWILSQPLTHDLDVHFLWSGLLATAGSDFTPMHDSPATALTIPAGETRLMLRVPIIADSDTSEPNEIARVTAQGISVPQNHNPKSIDITIIEPGATDVDEAVDLTISGAVAPAAALLPPGSGNSVPEGGRVTVTATVPTAPSGSSVTVPVKLVTTTQGADPDAAADDVVLGGSPAATVVIPDGQTSASITLTALADGGIAEGGGRMEWLFLEVDADGLTSGYRPGRAADILIEDTAAVPVALSVTNSGAITEGDGPLTITATLPAANDTGSAVAVPIEVRALGTTAQAGDYTLANSITIANGATTGTAAFAVINDSTPETDETVFVRLGASLPAGFGAGSPAVIEIVISDDGDTGTPPQASFASASYGVQEAGGARSVPVNLSAAAPSGGLTVSYTVGGSAVSGDDYTGAGGSVTVAQGQTSANISFTVTDDILAEGAETIVLTIADGAGYDPGTTATTTITINDNDAAPTNIALSVDDDSVGEGDGATTIRVTATVQGATRFADAKSVAVSVTGSGGANVVGFTAAPSTFSIPIAAGAQTGTGTFTLTPTDNSAVETDETVTVAGTLSGTTVASDTITVTDDDTAATPVTVTLSAAADDVTEGAAGAAGRKDVTITLGRALTGSETVTVPLSVQGATVGADYSFGLQPASQSGVSLLTGGSHSAQDPAVRFSAGATTAVLRFSPVNNAVRTQPYVVIGYGSGARAPSGGGGATLGAVTGGPVAFVVVDDETGDITVPSSWGLAPSGLGAGDDFRLLFRTSTTRDAASSDIADYDAFVRDAAATGGHADIVAYAGFFKAFASTRSSSGTTGTTARVHVGMASGHTGHFNGASDVWADGSTVPNAGSSAGTPIWWLGGAILANNYADLCDQAVASGSGVTAGWGVDDPRSEDGNRSIAVGATAGQSHRAWTGTGNACEAYDYPLGNSGNVSRAASHDVTWAFMHEGHSANTQQRPLYAMSPVFKIAGAAVVPTADFAVASSTAAESAGTRNITVNLVPAPAQSVTVSYALSGSAVRGSDYTISGVTSNSGTVAVGPSGTATIPVAVTDDSSPESSETVILTLGDGSGYTVGATTPAHTLTISDNDTAGVPAVSVTAGPAVLESGNAVFTLRASPVPAGTIAVRYTVTQNGQYLASGRLGSGKTRSLSGASATISIPTQPDSVDEADGSVTVTVTGGLGLGYEVGSPASATVTVRDDDVPAARFAVAASDADERSGTRLVRVSLSPVPHRGITVGYTVGGSATRGADFATPGTVSAAAGAAFVDIPVTIIGDAAAEPDETVVLTLTGGAGYRVGSPSVHTLTVADGPTGPPPALPVVTVTGGPAVIEGAGAGAVFTLSASVPAAAVSVRYTVAQNGQYVASGQLGSGKTQTLTGVAARVRVPVHDDDVDEAWGSVTVTLEAGSGYVVGSPASATVEVYDDELPVARFAARTSTAGEGSGIHHVRVLFSTAPHRDVFLGYWPEPSRGPASATRGADFTVPGEPVLVRAGATFADIPVTIVDDSIAEGAETVVLRLNIGRHYFLGTGAERRHTLTITDSGTAVTPTADFAVASSTAAESAGTRNIEVRLVPAPAQATTVSYALSGTAARGSDYTISGVTSNTGTVTVGTSGTATIPVAIVDDAAQEPDETVTLTLTGGAGYTVGTTSPTHTLTIAANDAPVVPQLSVTAGPPVDEGTPATFTVSASPAASGTVTVRYTVTQSGQYVASGQLGSGKSQPLSGAGATISVPTVGDSTDEADGSVTVTLEAAAGYTVGTPGTATVTVRDDDVPAAQFAAASSTAAESAGTRNITVRLVPAPAQSTTVSYALSGTAARGSDYTISGVTSNTGTIAVGTSGTAVIPVAITDDSAAESAETVVLRLTGGTGYTVGATSSHTLTITDNDTVGVPQVSVNAGSAVDEGGNAAFILSASPAATGTVSVRYTVAQNGQYLASGQLGGGKTQPLTGAGATISIPTVGDSADEADGSVTVTLSSGTGYTIGSPRTATVTVRDDDVPAAQFAAAASSAGEDSGTHLVRVSLSPAPHRRITVAYTLAGSAARGSDYTTPGTVTAAAGAAHVDIPVAITNDTAVEGAETVTLTLTAGAGYTVGSQSAHTLTITDDDAPPLPQVTVTAGPDAIEGAANATFTITATAAPAAPVTVRYTVTQNGQYVASGQLGTNKTRSLSGTTATISIPIHNDNADEADGSVTVTLDTGAGYTVGTPSTATVAVHDDDLPYASFAATASTAAESAGTHNVRVNFTIAPHRDLLLDYSALFSSTPGSATRRADFTVPGQPVFVPAGTTHVDIPVDIIDDNTREGTETFTLRLNIGRYYFLGPRWTRIHTITITDND